MTDEERERLSAQMRATLDSWSADNSYADAVGESVLNADVEEGRLARQLDEMLPEPDEWQRPRDANWPVMRVDENGRYDGLAFPDTDDAA